MDAPPAGLPPDASADLEDASLFINRELSWLAFNDRVLDQAFDRSWPALERLKFLAIHASNLDEFFMIRVSGLHEQLESANVERSADGLTIRQQLAKIRELVLDQQARASDLLLRDILPLLAEHGIRLRAFDSLSDEERERVCQYFKSYVFPVLTPLAVDPVHPFPFLSNLSLSLGVEVMDPETGTKEFARVKVPESLPRFVPISADGTPEGPREFVPLEELIANNLDELFPGIQIVGAYPFRVTRDMDLDILEDEAGDLLSVVDRQVRRRRFGAAVRLEHAARLPPRIRALLLSKLEIEDEDVYESETLLGVSSLFALATLQRPELRDPPLVQQLPQDWEQHANPFAVVRARDVLLHHPYDSFAPLLEFLALAADDPDVLAIKMTLYRAGSNAEAVRSLIRAAENGKQVAVSIELQARFDEEKNIAWARALERVGAHVFYGAAGLKTHAKALLVVRREGKDLRRYVHLSTGNYNATTARLYTDFGLLTCDAELGEDITNLFNSLSGFSARPHYGKIAVAPRTLRSALLDKIEGQIERARRGEPARVFAKLNALVDKQLIQALYRASNAGVDVVLVVRGTCCLRPGVPGVSERIRVLSLIGRFLEHERVLAFGVAESSEIFLSSADWMPRNLDRRVELLFPVTSERLRQQIEDECFTPLALDNSRVYELGSDGVYRRRRPPEDAAPVDAQAFVLAAAATRVTRGGKRV